MMKFDLIFAEGNAETIKRTIDVYKVEEDLDKLMEENHVWCEVTVSKMETDNVIEIERNWGDWKHDHLRIKYLVSEYLMSHGYTFSYFEEVTEEDGSDCYSAIHVYHFK